jgi:arginine utilization protein RocB
MDFDAMAAEMAALTKRLVATPSVNGTAGERAIADRIEAYLRDIPYFRAHPELVFTQDLAGDRLGRRNVFALLMGGGGRCADTILLHGHTDTVGVEDYGRLRAHAFDPDALARALADTPLPEEVRRDLLSGDYLFGRGACDMKSGDAVFLVLARHLSRTADRLRGNLLFSFNPVEENRHQGILEALPLLARLRETKGLRYLFAVNNDYICPSAPGDETRSLYLGSVGKLLPTFYVVGRETHVGQCFEGFSAALAAASLVRQLELNPALCDVCRGESTPPPAVLLSRDLKPVYNVQTPRAALVYLNCFVQGRETDELLARLREAACAALRETAALTAERGRAYGRAAGVDCAPPEEPGQALTYEELYRKVRADDPGVDEALNALADDLIARETDNRMVSAALVERLCERADIRTPTIVVFFATPYCPHNTLREEVPEERALRAEIAALARRFAGESGETMQVLQFFPSLTDSSYLKIDDSEASLRALRANFPGQEKLYPLPLETARSLNIPALNYGCFGKDAHKWTERVHMPYSFGQLPRLLVRTVDRFLTAADGDDKEQ